MPTATRTQTITHNPTVKTLKKKWSRWFGVRAVAITCRSHIGQYALVCFMVPGV